MKPGAFTQLYIHLVIAPKYREKLLVKGIRKEVFGYISGILTNRGHKSIIINGMADHTHIFYGMNPNDKVSDLVGCIKKESSSFINTKNWFRGRFHWQDGYGAFSYSHSQLDAVYKYIANQELHHKKRIFGEEYKELLKKFAVEYDGKYLFEFFNDINESQIIMNPLRGLRE
jgi:REP element-mobilizing transposase RayT